MSEKKTSKKKAVSKRKNETIKESLAGQIVTRGGSVVMGDVLTGGGDFVGRDKKVQTGEGGVVVDGDVTESKIVTGSGNVLHDYDIRISNATIHLAADRFLASLKKEEPSPDLRQATQRYFDYLIARYRYLDMRGLAVHDRLALRLPLLNLYVPLIARLEAPRGDTWERQALLAGRRLAREEEAEMRMGGLQPVLELLQKQAGLVVLGDPGSGKTTFLKYLALRLGAGEGRALGLGERLPILVPVSAYANALDRQGGLRLDDFIARYFHDIGADLPVADMLRKALQEGNALILLDGLDEVGSMSLRQRVAQRIADFCAFHKCAGNKFVLTSRIIGYHEVRLVVEDLVECVLADFTDEQIQAFLEHWSLVLEKQIQGDSEVARRNAERERQTLWAAIQRNAGVRALAANPLLLTILALVKRQNVTLPERRVELYEYALRTLLSTWNRARSLGEEDLPGRDLDERQIIRLLAPLALWMHQVNPGVGLVRRSDLEHRLESLFQERGDEKPQEAATRFMLDVHDHTGLLLERGPGMYGFIHLTFEEYLAAIAIAQKGQLDWKLILDEIKTHIGDPAWREILLLTIGYIGLIKLDDQVAGNLLEALVSKKPGGPGEAVLFAGEAVLDARPRGVPPKIQQMVTRALVVAMQDADTPPPLRRRAGLALGSLGWQPDDLEAFVEIPAGKFLMGSREDDPQAYEDEKPQREETISYRYWMAKYPVTNLQFVRFIAAGGYHQQEIWSKAGWRWREETGRTQPAYFEDREMGNPIFPVVGVSWYEAEAYCRWLAGHLPGFEIPTGYVLRLPTEAEWERAARFTDRREYPWGEGCDPKNANTTESGDMGTTAVCTYPLGKSKEGVWDMSGNVWEWSASWYDKDKDRRVLRGGSWFLSHRFARCARRRRYVPDYFVDRVGFRVVVSLAISDF